MTDGWNQRQSQPKTMILPRSAIAIQCLTPFLFNNYCFLINDFGSPTLFLRKDYWETQSQTYPHFMTAATSPELTHLQEFWSRDNPFTLAPLQNYSAQPKPYKKPLPTPSSPKHSTVSHGGLSLVAANWITLLVWDYRCVPDWMGLISRNHIVPVRMLRELNEMMLRELNEMIGGTEEVNASCSFYCDHHCHTFIINECLPPLPSLLSHPA